MLRWGILGTGNIARQFTAGINTAQRGRVVAVGSRTREAAEAFAASYEVPTAFGSYEQVLRSAEVDAVYVSLPNSLHDVWTIAALQAGKHVLCEKPIASDAAEAQEMFDVAQRSGLILAEAFMYRSHPQTLAILDRVREGAIGQLKLIRTSFCYRTTRVRDNIRFSAELAGGALMDIGCYCIDLSRLLAGQEPEAVHAVAQLHESGVDESAAGVLRFPGGILATFTCGMNLHADNTAHICGTEGFIEVPVPWKPPSRGAMYHLRRATPPKMDGAAIAAPPQPETWTVDAGKDLYALQVDDFAAAVNGEREQRVTRDDTLGNMKVLDELRRQVGVQWESRKRS